MTRLTKETIACCIIFSVFLSCLLPKLPHEAEIFVAAYFEAVHAKAYENVLPLYDERFFEKTDKITWLKMLNTIGKKLGDLQSYKLANWRSQSYTGVGSYPSGQYYVLVYDVAYTKYSAQETITVFKANGAKDLKILGHNIMSPGLVIE